MKTVESVKVPRKLCWAQGGQVVRLVNDMLELVGPPYLVVYDPAPPSIKATESSASLAANGLYSNKDRYRLADLHTGKLVEMTSLSRRAYTFYDATLTLGETPAPDALKPGDTAILWHEATGEFYEATIKGFDPTT